MFQCVASFVAQELACIDLPKPEGIKSCVTSYVKHEKFTRENNEILSSRTRHKKGTNGVSVSFKPPIKKTIEEVSNIESSERPKRKAAIVAATEVSRTLTLFERPKHASPPMAKHTTGKVHLTTVPSHKQQTPGKIVMPVFPSHKQPAAGKIAETISPNQKLRVYDHSKSSIQPSPTTKSAPPVSSLKKGSQSDVASSNPASSARRGIRKRLRSEENGAVAPPSVLPVLSDAPSEIDLEMQCLRSMVKTVADDFRCLVLAVKTHFPFCWTHRLRIMEGILMCHQKYKALTASWQESLQDVLTLFTSNGEVIDILQRVIVEDNVHTFLYMLYMLNKLTTSRQVTTDLNSSREGRDIVRQVLGEEAYSDLVIFLQQDSARPFTLDGWQTMRPVLIALQSEVTSMQSLVLRTWKPQAMERTVQDTAIILKGKLLCSTLFKEFELKEQLTSLLSQKAPGQQSAQPQLRTTYLRSLQHQQQYRQNHQRPQSEQLKERELPQQNMMSRSDSGASLLSLSSVASSGNIEHSDLSESQQSKHLHGSYPSLKQDAGLSSPVIGVIDDMSGSIDESENMEAAEDAGYGNIELLDQEDGRTGSTLSSFESRQEDEQGYEEVVALGTNEKSLPDDWLAQHMRNGDQLDADEPMAFSSPDAELVDDGRGYYGEDIMDTSSSDASICQQSDEEDESGLDNFIVKDDKEVNMGF